jgi:hypothetical protein
MRAFRPSAFILAGVLLAGTALTTGGGSAAAPTRAAWSALPQRQAPDTLAVGDRAPDFEIPSTMGIPEGSGTVRLSAITRSGRTVVLAFFPKAFTGG